MVIDDPALAHRGDRRRAPAAALALVVVVAMALVAGACSSAPPARRSGAGAVGSLEIGVSAHPLWENRNCDRQGCRAGGLAVRRQELDAIARAGAAWVRADVGWVNSEPDGPGQLDQDYAARVASMVRDAHRRRLKVLAVVWASPGWASGSPVAPTDANGLSARPPTGTHLGDYASFLASFVQRSGVDAVEVWNEPNDRSFWDESDPTMPSRTSVARYAQLVELAGQAVHGSAGRRVPVVAGVVARADDTWLGAMYAAGAALPGGPEAFRASFDALSAHPYPDPAGSGPDEPDTAPARQNLAHLDAVHDVMVQAGDGAKPMWVTELGWSTNEPCGSSGGRPGVSEATQASFLEGAVHRLVARPWVRTAFWYDIRDDGPDRCSSEDRFGLVRRDLSPKPAWAALRTLLHG